MNNVIDQKDIDRLLGYSKKDLAYNLVEVGKKLNENERLLVQFASFYREVVKQLGEEKAKEIEHLALEELKKDIEKQNSSQQPEEVKAEEVIQEVAVESV